MNTFAKLILLVIATSLFPLNTTKAVVQNLNGQSGSTQTFSNDLNIGISSANNTHTLNWSGVLPVSRGGTGESVYATGTIPFFWGGLFSNTTENNSRVSFSADQGLIINQGDISLVSGARIIWFQDEPAILEDGQSLETQYASLDSHSANTISLYDSTTNYRSTLDLSSLTASQDYLFPNYSGTFGLLESTQTWSGENTFSRGGSATTTVNFGEIGESSSKSCFNTKNTAGEDISFYFVGTSMVVENNNCN